VSAERRAIPERTKVAVLTESGFKCANPTCQTTLALDHHHIEYVCEGGSNGQENLVALCPTCHSLHHRGTIPLQSIVEWKKRIVALSLAPKHELREELEKRQLRMGFDSTVFPSLIRQLTQIELDVLEWTEEKPREIWVGTVAIAFGKSPSGRFRGGLGGKNFLAVRSKLEKLGLILEIPIGRQEPVIYAKRALQVTPLGHALLQACRAVVPSPPQPFQSVPSTD
jgi:hypothetical protein